MTRTEKQKRLATAAKSVATKFQNNTLKTEILNYGYQFYDGTPESPIGVVLQQAGIRVPKSRTVSDAQAVVAKALGTTADVLPTELVTTIDKVEDAINRSNSYLRRRAAVAPLREFAKLIASTKIRKPYTRTTTTTIGTTF